MGATMLALASSPVVQSSPGIRPFLGGEGGLHRRAVPSVRPAAAGAGGPGPGERPRLCAAAYRLPGPSRPPAPSAGRRSARIPGPPPPPGPASPARRDGGDIGRPDSVGRRRAEPPVDHVRGRGPVVVRVGRAPGFPPGLGGGVRMHRPGRLAHAAVLAPRVRLGLDPGATAAGLDPGMGRLDGDDRRLMSPRPGARRPRPTAVAAGRGVRGPAHRPGRSSPRWRPTESYLMAAPWRRRPSPFLDLNRAWFEA